MTRRATLLPDTAMRAMPVIVRVADRAGGVAKMKIRQQRSPRVVQVAGPSVMSTRGDTPCNATISWT